MKLQTKENTVRLSHKRIGGRLNHVSNKSIQNRLSRRDKEKQNSSAESQATDRVEQTTNTISYETRYQIKRFATKQKNKRRIAQLEKENNLNIRNNEVLRQYSSPSFNQHKLTTEQRNKNTFVGWLDLVTGWSSDLLDFLYPIHIGNEFSECLV